MRVWAVIFTFLVRERGYLFRHDDRWLSSFSVICDTMQHKFDELSDHY